MSCHYHFAVAAAAAAAKEAAGVDHLCPTSTAAVAAVVAVADGKEATDSGASSECWHHRSEAAANCCWLLEAVASLRP